MITNIYIEPNEDRFSELSIRPKKDTNDMIQTIESIYKNVIDFGDKAIVDYTRKFDNCALDALEVSSEEIERSESQVSEELKDAIRKAKSNIETFHGAQIADDLTIETLDGVICQQRSVGIEKVGLYIPGGTAPLFSTVLMLAVPASLAGCKEIIMCSPPNSNGEINPAILWTAALCGVTRIYKVGGAQAIAGMSIGTESIPRVSKIFGPGNQFVTAAKINAQNYGVSIDMPAGPSELLVYAADDAVPSFVASDLLSQAEHGSDSQVILVAQSVKMINSVNLSLIELALELPRLAIVKESIASSKAILINDVDKAFRYINDYAPEHLIIASETPDIYVDKIVNAGSVFLGNYCPESAGDYASGTNHTLPTDGWAKSYNGVNVDSFSRKITFQKISKNGIKELGNTIITMAENEQLQAHANAVKVRLQAMKTDS